MDLLDIGTERLFTRHGALSETAAIKFGTIMVISFSVREDDKYLPMTLRDHRSLRSQDSVKQIKLAADVPILSNYHVSTNGRAPIRFFPYDLKKKTNPQNWLWFVFPRYLTVDVVRAFRVREKVFNLFLFQHSFDSKTKISSRRTIIEIHGPRLFSKSRCVVLSHMEFLWLYFTKGIKQLYESA